MNKNQENIKNRTIFTRDCLEVMRGMADQSVDLIYLDPPFNSNANYAAPIGSSAAGAEFKDTWCLSDIDIAWHGEIAESYPGLYQHLKSTQSIHGESMMSYLIYMASRIIEMQRILKYTGSIYLHCDTTASHYLKLVMDSVFGKNNFMNEVIWHYGKWSNAIRYFQKNHDVLFFYSKDKSKHVFNKLSREDESYHYEKGWHTNVLQDGTRQLIVYDKQKAAEKIAQGYDKIIYREGKIKASLADVWDIPIINPMAKERTGYPTQKPLKLLQNIIKASSNEKDVVLDPFCGCATSCIAAEIENRQWIGIDVSEKAFELVKSRLKTEVVIGEDTLGLYGDVIHRADIPKDRNDKLSINIKHTLYGKQEGLCNGCEAHFPFRNMTKDYIVSTSKGGANTDDNLQLLCGACNSKKGGKMQEELKAQLRKERII